MRRFITNSLFNELESSVPKHTQESINDYILKGWAPSGFLEAILTNDLFRATQNSDHVNFQAIGPVTKWIIHNAPDACWGNTVLIDRWLADEKNVRSNFVKEFEQQNMWERLND